MESNRGAHQRSEPLWALGLTRFPVPCGNGLAAAVLGVYKDSKDILRLFLEGDPLAATRAVSRAIEGGLERRSDWAPMTRARCSTR